MKRNFSIKNRVDFVYLKNLIDKSLKIINLGIEEINNIYIYNIQDYDFAFLCLAKGFENILKILVCCKTYAEKKTFPTQKKLKTYGHNLTTLLDEIIPYYELKQNTLNREDIMIIQSDIEYLKKDKMLNKLIELLSKYNISGRYFELDFVSNDNIFKKMNNQYDDSIEINPIIRLNGIIYKSLIDENPALKEIESECDLKEPWLEFNRRKIAIPFKKLLGILFRQIGTGIYGEECKKFTSKEKYLYLKSVEYSVEKKDMVNLEQLK